MSLKRKEILTRQKAYSEKKLAERKSLLTERGLDAARIDKDPVYRKLRADVRTIESRLRTVAASEKLTLDLKKMKADRAAEALKEKEATQAEKPKKEKGPQEAKPKKEKGEKPEKQEKGEKKPAGPKPQEGAKEAAAEPKAPKAPKAPKPAEGSEEPKA